MRFQKITSVLARKKRINLALQGGGSHGAFTWGVLDYLLKEENLVFEAVSGTSAGAINAIAMAAGLAENGPAGASEKLNEIWNKIHKITQPSSSALFPMGLIWGQRHIQATAQKAMQKMTQHLSPYEFNPMDINPLRNILTETIDFEMLRKKKPVKLFIAATNASTGHARIFRNDEITADVILASACLPLAFKAIQVGDEFYWDGGYSSNPDLLHMITETRSCDTLLVMLSSIASPKLPTTKDRILENINRITFNKPLCREVEIIERSKRLSRLKVANDQERRFQRTRFHMIDASSVTAKLSDETKMWPEKELLEYLFKSGKTKARKWLKDNKCHLGRRSSTNLYSEFIEC